MKRAEGVVAPAGSPPTGPAAASPPFWSSPDGSLLKRVLGIGALGVGVGAGARALFGAKDLVSGQMQRSRVPKRPAVVEVNVPHVPEEEEEETLAPRRAFNKVANPTTPTPAPAPAAVPAPETRGLFHNLNPINWDLSGITKHLNPANWGGDTSKDPSWWSRASHTSDARTPWFIPAAMGLGAGGIYAGYKGLGAALDTIKGRDKKRELDDAKEDYRKALIEQYSADSPAIKRGAHSELRQDLDVLYQLYSPEMAKVAENTAAPAPSQYTPGTASDLAGLGTGMYLPLAALLAGGAGYMAYNAAKRPSADEQLAKAIKQRERLRWATRPPEIYAVAKNRPASIRSPVEEDETAKIAALYRR